MQALPISVDPTGFIMRQKLDGIYGVWDGKAMYSKSGKFINFGWNGPACTGELYAGLNGLSKCISAYARGALPELEFIPHESIAGIVCKSREHALDYMHSPGFEGVVLTAPNGDQYKLKPYLDDECLVIGHNQDYFKTYSLIC